MTFSLPLKKKFRMNIEATKLELIKLIADEQSERLLEQVRLFFKKVEKAGQPISKKTKTTQTAAKKVAPNLSNGNAQPPSNASKEQLDMYEIAKQPMPYFISVEELAKEQGYDPNKLWEVMKDWDYSLFEDQTLEELLNSLTP
jgi:phosphoenolpyruvate carboxylase